MNIIQLHGEELDDPPLAEQARTAIKNVTQMGDEESITEVLNQWALASKYAFGVDLFGSQVLIYEDFSALVIGQENMGAMNVGVILERLIDSIEKEGLL